MSKKQTQEYLDMLEQEAINAIDTILVDRRIPYDDCLRMISNIAAHAESALDGLEEDAKS